MSGPFRILHVDDEIEIRNIVELSLGVDPTFTVITCANGRAALAIAAEWAPDLIVCDVMMPGMDGPAFLAQLREGAATVNIPVIFTTTTVPAKEVERLKSLGALAVLIKPLDPAKLAELVRDHLRFVSLGAAGENFANRLRTDGATLAMLRVKLTSDSHSALVLESLQACAHKLAGAAGIYGYQATSQAAAALEQAVVARRAGADNQGSVETSLDALLDVAGSDAPAAAPVASMAGTAGAVAATRAPRMLIADDDPAILKSLAERCTDMGFEVETATNGVQALIKAHRRRPDALIVDVNMPELDGISVCKRLQNSTEKNIGVIVISGSEHPDTPKQCESLGAFYGRKGPDFWSSIVASLVALFPGMADRIKAQARNSMDSEVRLRPRVLLVDDDPEVGTFLSRRLAKCGIDLLYAPDSVKGFRLACKEQPSVIICDYFIPNGDVLYLLWRLRTTPVTKNIPVFVLSEAKLDESTQQILKREVCGGPGASRIFQKSFDTDELFGALQKVCGFHDRRLRVVGQQVA